MEDGPMSEQQSGDTERKTVEAGRDSLVPLTEQSDNDWSLHIRNSSFIVTFSRVSKQEGGGLHCWSDGRVVLFVAEDDDFVPNPIQDKLRALARTANVGLNGGQVDE